MTQQLIFNKAIKPNISAIREVRDDIIPYLSEQLPEDQQNSITLVLSEWLTNLLTHSLPPPSTITIEIVVIDNQYSILIKDNGGSFDNYDNYQGLPDDFDAYTLKESGLGLKLIKYLNPYVSYEPGSGKPNCFTIPFNICKYNKNDSLLHIALVEDDIVTINIITSYLKDNYKISSFSNPHKFLDSIFIDNNMYNLIISDINMPELNGINLRRELTKNKNTDIIPFIFLTGKDDESLEDSANQLGIDDYLIKPISKKQLLRVVNRVLTRKTTERVQLSTLLDEKVTETLRPSLNTTLGTYECQLYNQNASAGGGDFLVHFKQDDSDIVILGDVMGHGIAAKFFAHSYAGYIQGLIKSSQSTCIAKLLQNFSNLIRDDKYLESIIITCIAIQLKDDALVIANAGHPKPILLRNNNITYIDVAGSLPGIESSASYDSHEIKLCDNDKLIIYTDGLFEIGENNSERDYNKENILNILKRNCNNKSSLIKENIKLELDKFNDYDVKDDITFVIFNKINS